MLQHNADVSGADSSAVGSISQSGVYTTRPERPPRRHPILRRVARLRLRRRTPGDRHRDCPGLRRLHYRVDSVSYPVSATLDDGWTVTGTLSVGNTDWVPMSDPGYLNNVVGQAYDVPVERAHAERLLDVHLPRPEPPAAHDVHFSPGFAGFFHGRHRLDRRRAARRVPL